MKKILLFSIAVLVALPIAADEALDIIRRVDEQQTAETGKAEFTMLVYPDADDESNVRESRVLSYSKGDEDSYMVFLEPRSIKGLSILSKGDDQWAFFPSTGRVRKIAGKSKKESVRGVGGDFSYEDLGGGNFEEKYSFRIAGEDKNSWTIEGTPIKDSSYSRILLTVEKESYQMQKIEFYTEEDGHFKDMYMNEVKEIGGREMPTRIEMRNLLKNSMTVVVTHAAEYDMPIDDKYFNPTRFYR